MNTDFFGKSETTVFIAFPYSGIEALEFSEDPRVIYSPEAIARCKEPVVFMEWKPGITEAIKELGVQCAVIVPRGDMQNDWIGRAYKAKDIDMASKFAYNWSSMISAVYLDCQKYEFPKYELWYLETIEDAIRIIPYMHESARDSAPELFRLGVPKDDLRNIQICVNELIDMAEDAQEIWLTGQVVNGVLSNDATYEFVIVTDIEHSREYCAKLEYYLDGAVIHQLQRSVDPHVMACNQHELQDNPYLKNVRNHHVVMYRNIE